MGQHSQWTSAYVNCTIPASRSGVVLCHIFHHQQLGSKVHWAPSTWHKYCPWRFYRKNSTDFCSITRGCKWKIVINLVINTEWAVLILQPGFLVSLPKSRCLKECVERKLKYLRFNFINGKDKTVIAQCISSRFK